MTDRNQFSVLGHAGAPPTLRAALTGGLVATFNLATHYRRRDGRTGEWSESTEWHRITVFDELAKIAQESIVAGTRVAVEGYMRTRTFLDGHMNNRDVHEHVALYLATGAQVDAAPEAPVSPSPAATLPRTPEDDMARVI